MFQTILIVVVSLNSCVIVSVIVEMCSTLILTLHTGVFKFKHVQFGAVVVDVQVEI